MKKVMMTVFCPLPAVSVIVPKGSRQNVVRRSKSQRRADRMQIL